MGTALQRMERPKTPRGFQRGNQLAKNGIGIQRQRRFVTQRLISELNSEYKYKDEKGKSVITTKIARACELIVTAAAEGDLEAFRFVTERVEGRVPQAIEVSGRDGRPIESITVTMTPAEAARLYAQALVDIDGCVAVDADNLPELERGD